MAYGQAPSGALGGGTQGKTSLGDYLGTTSNANLGTPDVDPNAFQYGGQAGGAAARQNQLSALGASGASTAGQAPYQSAQMSALAQAQQQANGNDFGAVQAQLNSGLAQSQAASASQAASSRGGGANLAAAQNTAANTQAAQGAAAGNNAAQLKAQMQNQGVQNLNAFASGGLGQAIQQNQFNAGQQLQYEGLGNQIGLGQLNAQGNQQQLQSQNQLAQQQQAMQQGQFNAQSNQSMLGGVASAIGSVGSLFSDANQKYGIESESGQGGVAGQSALARMDAQTANFSHESPGMQVWSNISNAKPWSPAAAAAQGNANHFFFTSDEDQKTETKPEGATASSTIDAIGKGFSSGIGKGAGYGHEQGNPYLDHGRSIYAPVTSDTRAKKNAVREDALAEAARKLSGDVDDRNLAMAMRPTAIQQVAWDKAHPAQEERFADVISGGQSDPFRNLQHRDDNMPRKGEPMISAADKTADLMRPFTFDYKNPAENGGNRRLGTMAQLLEQAPTGADMVKNTPNGKVLDIPAVTSSHAAILGRLSDRDLDNRERIDALESRLGDSSGAKVLPAGQANLAPSLAPREHGIFDAYGGGQKLYAMNGDDTAPGRLTSDTRAKKNAILEEGRRQGAAGIFTPPARELAQDDRTSVIKHTATNPDEDEAWRRAIVAQSQPMPFRDRVELAAPMPPPIQSKQDERMQARLDAYNAQADASLRSAVRGEQPQPSALVASEHPIPASFQPASAHRDDEERMLAQRGGMFAPAARMR